LVASWLIAASACQPRSGSPAVPGAPSSPGQAALVPLGDLAGAAKFTDAVVNPWEGNAAAIERGHELFVSMNCAGCHGYDAAGNMGPNLTDRYWRYGGAPSQVYQSILEGRPQGMPAWGAALPREEIWKIVAYLQSLGGMVASTHYHEGLQGDHDVSSTAPEIDAVGASDSPRTAPAPASAATT